MSTKEEGVGVPPVHKPMTTFWIIVPLAVLAIGIAVLPVLVGSYRQDRSIKEGAPATTRVAVHEANQWHSRLGRRMRRRPRELEPGSDATHGSTGRR